MGLQRRQLGVDLLQLFFVGIEQLRAGADEIFIIAIEQIGGLRIEADLVALVIELLNAGEQFGVQMNGVVMGRKLRRHLLVDFLQLGIGVARVEVREDAVGAIKQAAG